MHAAALRRARDDHQPDRQRHADAAHRSRPARRGSSPSPSLLTLGDRGAAALRRTVEDGGAPGRGRHRDAGPTINEGDQVYFVQAPPTATPRSSTNPNRSTSAAHPNRHCGFGFGIHPRQRRRPGVRRDRGVGPLPRRPGDAADDVAADPARALGHRRGGRRAGGLPLQRRGQLHHRGDARRRRRHQLLSVSAPPASPGGGPPPPSAAVSSLTRTRSATCRRRRGRPRR